MADSLPSIPSPGKSPSLIRLLPANQPRSSPYCTHRTLTRLFDNTGHLQCMVCHQVPDFGYLYRCTQETNGNLPLSDFTDEDLSMNFRDLSVSNSLNTTNSSGATPSVNSCQSASSSLPVNATVEAEDNMDNQAAIDETLAQAYDGKRKFEAAFPLTPVENYDRCNLRICTTCRPGYKDRAFQSLGEIVNHPVILPLQQEFNNRRVSDAATILAMQPARARLRRENANTDFPRVGPQVMYNYFGSSSDSDSDDVQDATSRNSGTSSPEIIVDSPMHGEGSDGSDADDEKEGDGDSNSDDSGTDVTIDLHIESDGANSPPEEDTDFAKRHPLRRSNRTITGRIGNSGPTPGRFVID